MKVQLPPPDNDIDFESLCLEMYKLEYPNTKPQKIGCPGQKQKGVDISIPEEKIGVQCKKKEYWSRGRVTKQQLIDIIDGAKQFEPSLKQLIIATTCKRDANIQEVARKISEEHKKDTLFSVKIESEVRPIDWTGKA